MTLELYVSKESPQYTRTIRIQKIADAIDDHKMKMDAMRLKMNAMRLKIKKIRKYVIDNEA